MEEDLKELIAVFKNRANYYDKEEDGHYSNYSEGVSKGQHTAYCDVVERLQKVLDSNKVKA